MNQTYFVLKDKESYWNGWHWSLNIKTAKKYINKDDCIEDLEAHSYELNGVKSGTLVEVKETIEILSQSQIKWKS